MNKYEFKGTQGEWKLENRYVKAGYRLTPIAEPHGLLPIDENDANLNLIAAAPQLLQACIEMVDQLCGDQEAEDELEKGLGRPLYYKMASCLRCQYGQAAA